MSLLSMPNPMLKSQVLKLQDDVIEEFTIATDPPRPDHATGLLALLVPWRRCLDRRGGMTWCR